MKERKKDEPKVLQEISKFLEQVYSLKRQTYSSFLSAWKKADFSLLHFGCVSSLDRPFFMDMIFTHILSPLSPECQPEIITLVVYMLWCVYKTQPLNSQSIYITIEQLTLLREHVLASNNTDLVYVMSRLENVFVMTITDNVDESSKICIMQLENSLESLRTECTSFLEEKIPKSDFELEKAYKESLAKCNYDSIISTEPDELTAISFEEEFMQF